MKPWRAAAAGLVSLAVAMGLGAALFLLLARLHPAPATRR